MAHSLFLITMLFAITRDQYQKYGEKAVICRRYILDHYPALCDTVNVFNRYFGVSKVDICGALFEKQSLLLEILEEYEEEHPSGDYPIETYLQDVFDDVGNNREGIFEGLRIYVWWPEVTVTNEKGQHVVITDLYAMIPIRPDGSLWDYFKLSRATYTYEQYVSGYMHSHVNGINPNPASFMSPCLGSGPLNRTQSSLQSRDNVALWDLFCVELDRYVTVESVEGVPYRYLDRIGTALLRQLHSGYGVHRSAVFAPMHNFSGIKDLFTKFFKYVLIRKKMKFSYSDGLYRMAYSHNECILKLSNAFIKFYSMMRSAGKTDVTIEDLLSNSVLLEVKKNGNELYTIGSPTQSNTSYRSFCNQHVLYFKGESIKTHVSDPVDFQDNTYYVIAPGIVRAFLDQCLNYLNIYEHEKDKNVIQESESGSGVSCGVKNSFVDYPVGEKRIALSL